MTLIDQIVDRVLQVVLPKVVGMLAQHGGRDREGIILKGSYDPSDGTATVAFGDTIAVFGDSGDTPILVPRVPIKTPHVGDQYGPLGDERVKISATQSGYAAEMVHGPNDSPGAPAGERWIAHRRANGTYDTIIKLTNDAASKGDRKGGFSVSGGALIALATAGGLSLTMDDATGLIMIGKPGLGTADALVTATDLQETANAIIANAQTTINALARIVSGGSGVAAPTISSVTATGSTIAEAAE